MAAAFTILSDWCSIRTSTASTTSRTRTVSSTTSLYAINVLAKKAKLQLLREEIISASKDGGIQPKIQQYMDQIQLYEQEQQHGTEQSTSPAEISPGPLQTSLMRRKGTLTIIGEYKRKLSAGSNSVANLNEVYKDDPTIVSKMLRESGASAISIVADERMGECTYDDLELILEEQRRTKNDIPGPLHVINCDYIVDPYQIIKTSITGASVFGRDDSHDNSRSSTSTSSSSNANTNTIACIVQYELFPSIDEIKKLLHIAYNICKNVEIIVSVTNQEQAQAAIDAGSTMICVNMVTTGSTRNNDGSSSSSSSSSSTSPPSAVQEQVQVLENLVVQPGRPPVCYICMIHPRQVTTNLISSSSSSSSTKTAAPAAPTSAVLEIEDAWYVRDKGFHCAYITGEVLFKGSSTLVSGGGIYDQVGVETPGAIVKSMKSKSSLKYASPQPRSGRGEGAREYLGDILM